MGFLKVADGPSSGQVLALAGGKVVLGRHPSCQIVLDHGSVSRHHAQIYELNGAYVIEDLRSRNGTQINRQSIRKRTELHDGDEIKVCDYTFVFLKESPGRAIAVTTGSSIIGSPVPAGNRSSPGAGTIDDEFDPDIPPSAEYLANASVLAALSAATHEQRLRLNVRPEAKLRAILEISTALGNVLKLDDALPVILKTLFKIFPQADSGFVLLKEPHTGKLRVRTSYSRRNDDEVPVSLTVVRQAMKSGQAILSADVCEDQRFQFSESVANMQLRSLMCTPLMDTDGDSLGVLQLSTMDVSQPFNSDDLDLLISVGSQAGMAIENGTMHETLLRQRDLERDMEIAAQVQQSFLPSEPPTIAGYEFAHYYQSAQSVGGDLFDYVRLPDGRWAFVIADVSGKGVPAALLMAHLRASCRHHLFGTTSAERAMNDLNLEMANSPLGYRFITLSIAILDPAQNEVHLASAGHPPPVLRRRGKPTDFVGLKESGMPLGILDEQNYKSLAIKIEPGDTLLFYTDGITEAINSRNELFAKERIRDTIAAGPESATELVPKLIQAVDAFCEGEPQRDDTCVTAFRRLT